MHTHRIEAQGVNGHKHVLKWEDTPEGFDKALEVIAGFIVPGPYHSPNTYRELMRKFNAAMIPKSENPNA